MSILIATNTEKNIVPSINYTVNMSIISYFNLFSVLSLYIIKLNKNKATNYICNNERM